MKSRIKVMIAVGDEAVARQLATELAQHGWEVLQARDAVSATAGVLRSRPDAVILSGQLPGGSGVLILKRIRASVHTASTPVLAIAGRRAGDAEELLSHGADDCLPPPLDVSAVLGWVRKRLAQPREVMEAPAAIISDAERLAALARTQLLDSPPTGPFDTVTRLAATLLGVPVALVSLVDRDRQFFKSQFGLPEPWASARETPLTHSFCQWVVSGHEALVVSDAREHPVLSVNRALHELGVIAYAGIPLTATTGDPIGSFCAIDTKPRNWSENDLALLRELSRVAEACIAVGESVPAAGSSRPGAEGGGIPRSLVMQALGAGISSTTDILRRDDPRLGAPERTALLELLEWFGRQVVRLAGA